MPCKSVAYARVSSHDLLKQLTERLHDGERRAKKKKGLHAFACNPSILLLNLGAADQHRTSIPTRTRMALGALQNIIISMTY
jgi:hypothetical protein